MKRSIGLALMVSSTLCILASCRHTRKTSDVTEAPDAKNEPSRLGIPPPYPFNAGKNLTSGAAEPAWSDTYWPHWQRSIAARWAAKNVHDQVTAEPESLAKALRDMARLTAAGDWQKLNYLSPAEKFDILTGKFATMPPEVWTEVDRLEQDYSTKVTPKLAEVMQEEQLLQQQAQDARKVLETKSAELDQAYQKVEEAGGSDKNPDLKKRADDLAAALQGYWKDLSNIEAQIRRLPGKKRELRGEYTALESDLAKKVATYTPMTAQAWSMWGHYESSHVSDFTWMGLCHGWAPASISVAKPEHGVLAEKNGVKVFFTEGDLRGLATTVWATQQPESFFAARRCGSETETLPLDSHGRVIDGSLCLDRVTGTCTAESGVQIYVQNNNIEKKLIEFREKITDSQSKYAVVTRTLGHDHYEVKVLNSKNDVQTWLQTPDKVTPRSGVLNLTMGCRDVNPMTLHLALTKLLGEKKQRFVIDKDRNAQVWNQPVFAYNLEYRAIPLKDNSTSNPGEPVDIALISDPLAPFRATGTKYLVQVMAKVSFGLESGPLPNYKKEDESSQNETYVYTLELDKDQNIIGGEWGSFVTETREFKPLSTYPDFIWYPIPSEEPRNLPYDWQTAKALLHCSREQATASVSLPFYNAGKKSTQTYDLPYSECKL